MVPEWWAGGLRSSESLKVPGQWRPYASMIPESGKGKGTRTIGANQFDQLIKFFSDVTQATSPLFH